MAVPHKQPIDVFRPVTEQFEEAYRAAGPGRGALHVPLIVREAYIAAIAKRQGSMAGSWLRSIQEGQLHYGGLRIIVDGTIEPGFIEVRGLDRSARSGDAGTS